MTTRKTPLPTALRRLVLFAVAFTAFVCSSCGFDYYAGYKTCEYCGTVYTAKRFYDGGVHSELLPCGVHCEALVQNSGFDVHNDKCDLCGGFLCTGAHGDTVCNKGQGSSTWWPEQDSLLEDNEPDTPPTEQQDEPQPEAPEKPEEPEQPEQPEQPKEPMVAIPYCRHCQQTTDVVDEHLAPCGDHYTCETGYDPELHMKRADCDHYECDTGDHYPCDCCGGMLCADSAHSFYSCVFMHTNCPQSTADDAWQHKQLPCNYHWDCDDTAPGGEHTQLACGCCSAWTDHFMDCEHYGQPVA